MNIGVVTVYDADNCGAFLQAYALKKVLEQCGHNVFHVKYRSRKQMKDAFFKRADITTTTFIKRHFGFTYKSYKIFKMAINHFNEISPDDIQKMDLLVVGSDELWNVTNENVRRDVNKFNYKCRHKIAYAVSSGNSTYKDLIEYPTLIQDIKSFDKIFPRDIYTKKSVDRITNVDNKLVCDPTLLIDKSNYKSVNYKRYHKEYILFYAYYSDHNTQQIVKQYARRNGLKVLGVGIKNYWCDDNITCNPMNFSAYVRDAKIVVTATFHGTIFSLINEKNVVFLNYGSRKLEYLLGRLNLDDRILNLDKGIAHFLQIIDTKINYYNVNEKIRTMRQNALKELERALGEVENG